MNRPPFIYAGSLLLLLATVLVSARAGREVDVSDFPLSRVPDTIGEWTRVQSPADQKTPSPASSETETVGDYRIYANRSDLRVSVTLKATRSRIGSLRDYTTAVSAQGWTPGPRTAWGAQLPGVPFTVQAAQQQLRQGPGRLHTLNWYVSPGRQSLTLQEAAVAGWGSRITGQSLWGQVYLSIASKEESPAPEKALTDFATRLFPVYYQLLCDYAQQAPGAS